MEKKSEDMELNEIKVDTKKSEESESDTATEGSKLLGTQTKNETEKTDNNQQSSESTKDSTPKEGAPTTNTTEISEPDMALLRDACKKLGFSKSMPSHYEIYRTYLKPLIETKQIDKLRDVLNIMKDNVRWVAHDLLYEATFRTDDDEILREVLQHNLPDYEIQSVFATWLQYSNYKPGLIGLFCQKRPELTRLYMYDEKSFPLLYVVKQFTESHRMRDENNEENCIEKIELLLQHGADINARSLDKPSPIHLAAERGAWKVVKILLGHNANIDIENKGVTARNIIEQHNVELVENYEKQCENKTIKDKMYDALYEEDEGEFLKLLDENKKLDVDDHNGRETFLQLAIIKKFKKSVKQLMCRNANPNLVAGFAYEPILLVFQNPGLECLYELYNFSLKYCVSTNILHNSKRFVRSGTVLHFLADISFESVAEHLDTLQRIVGDAVYYGVNVCAVDSNGVTAYQKIAKRGHRGDTLMLVLLCHMFPDFDTALLQITPPHIIEQYFDLGLRNYQSNLGKMEINYNFMRPKDIKYKEIIPEMRLFYEMSKIPEHAKTALLHPLVKLFLVYKWRKVAFIFFLNFILYALFTIFLSIHVYKLVVVPRTISEIYHGNVTQTFMHNPRQFDCWHIVGIVFWIPIFVREVFQFALTLRRYINWENCLEFLLLIFSLLTYLPFLEQIKYVFCVMAILLTYIELTLLIGRYPSNIGIYTTMLVRVTKKSLTVCLIFAAFLFSFAFSFFIVFGEAATISKSDYDSLWNTFLRTISMAVGEINFNDIQSLGPFGRGILLLVFVLLVTIVFMNLLNALAISDTQNIINETQAICCVADIQRYTSIEALLLRYDPEKLNIQEYRNRSFKRNWLFEKLSSLIMVFPPIDQKYVIEYDFKGTNILPHIEAPTFTNCCQKVCFWLRYFYYRKLLHCDEDAILKQIHAKTKYHGCIKCHCDPLYVIKLQRGMDQYGKRLQNFKSQNKKNHQIITNQISELKNGLESQSEKCQEKLTDQINANFTSNTEVQGKMMEKQENVCVTLDAMQKQISELKNEIEAIKSYQISQVKEVHRDLSSVKKEISTINENLRGMLTLQQQLQEILTSKLATSFDGTNQHS